MTLKGIEMKNKVVTIFVLGVATWLALYIGGSYPIIGTSISAILIGAIIRHTVLYKELDKKIVKFVSSYLLKTGIVLLGFTLSLRILDEVGANVLLIMVAVIVVSVSASKLANKGMNVDKTLSLLIGIGTSICGGSAIVAAAPVLEAEDESIAVSVTTMFIYSMMALLFLPTIGKLFGFTDQMYGILSGVAVNDTASVVATSFAWSDAAGSIATVVKLVRTLFIVPVTIGIIFYKYSQNRKEEGVSAEKVGIDWNQIKKTIPMFVIFFVLAVAFASVVAIPADITSIISKISKLCMTIALITIGLGVHIAQIKKAGLKPVVLGAASWTAVLAVSVASIIWFYGA